METLIEQIVEMPVINPDSGSKSRSFVYMGKVDEVTSDRVIDYKNTANIGRFIHTMTISFQAEMYALAVHHQFKRVLTDMEYRLVQRPGLKFTPKDAEPNFAVREVGKDRAAKAGILSETKARRYAETKNQKRKALNGPAAFLVEDRTKPAVTRDTYEQRCYQQLIDEPERVRSHSLHLNGGAMQEAQGHLWTCSKRVLENRRTGRWLPNAQACYDWNKECPFIQLCDCVRAGAKPDWIIEDNYRVVENSHPELGDVGKGRMDVLTHSSCGALARCEVFYFWAYERGLRRGVEDSEALWIGNAMHRGMEVFAKEGLDAALLAIDEWAEQNPVLGDDVRKQDEQIAKSRAMVRAASERWG
jgi:hypothetical protein